MESAKENLIRNIVRASVTSFADGFKTRHISEVDNQNGTINQKIYNVFIAALGEDIQYYSALVRSLDSSLGSMLERMAVNIASNFYTVTKHVEGSLSEAQTHQIASLLEAYKRRTMSPSINDYGGITRLAPVDDDIAYKRHESDYYLHDEESNSHYLIELKIGGDLDNKKARSEKEALLEQFAILANRIGEGANIKIFFATAYNRFGEGNEWRQERVRQFFANEELLISKDFWDFICKDSDGYSVILDEYQRNAEYLKASLDEIKECYLG